MRRRGEGEKGRKGKGRREVEAKLFTICPTPLSYNVTPKYSHLRVEVKGEGRRVEAKLFTICPTLLSYNVTPTYLNSLQFAVVDLHIAPQPPKLQCDT